MPLRIISPVFEYGKMIPPAYTCAGKDISPPLDIVGVPDKTQSLVLIVDDPDAPRGNWDHWIVINIPPATHRVAQGTVPKGGIECMNDFGKTSWGGPCPPSGTHRYFFKLYALDTLLSLTASARKKDVESAIKGHVLEKAELMGRFTKV